MNSHKDVTMRAIVDERDQAIVNAAYNYSVASALATELDNLRRRNADLEAQIAATPTLVAVPMAVPVPLPVSVHVSYTFFTPITSVPEAAPLKPMVLTVERKPATDIIETNTKEKPATKTYASAVIKASPIKKENTPPLKPNTPKEPVVSGIAKASPQKIASTNNLTIPSPITKKPPLKKAVPPSTTPTSFKEKIEKQNTINSLLFAYLESRPKAEPLAGPKTTSLAHKENKKSALADIKKSIEALACVLTCEQINIDKVKNSATQVRGKIKDTDLAKLLKLLRKKQKYHKLNIAIYKSEQKYIANLKNRTTPQNEAEFKEYLHASSLANFNKKKADLNTQMTEYLSALERHLALEKTALTKCNEAYNIVSSLFRSIPKPATAQEETPENSKIIMLIEGIDTHNISLIKANGDILKDITDKGKINLFIEFIKTKIARSTAYFLVSREFPYITHTLREIRAIKNHPEEIENLDEYKLTFKEPLQKLNPCFAFNLKADLTIFEAVFDKLLTDRCDYHNYLFRLKRLTTSYSFQKCLLVSNTASTTAPTELTSSLSHDSPPLLRRKG